MADYRNIGKVADDLFGTNPGKKTQDSGTAPENAALNNDESADHPEISIESDFSDDDPEFSSGIEQASGAILDNIRRIRQMVESDLQELDEISRKNTRDTEEQKQYTTFPVPDDTKPADTEPGQSGSAQAGKEKEEERPAMEELDELIGLDSIKADVKELIDLVKTQKLRKEQGLKSVPVSLHLVFSGNPGTGKTTVARILARLYKEIGVLSKGQLIEVDRSGLVAGFIGQTAIKTQEKIQQAMGGILFIDEAYTLAKEGQDYGQEAIDTILKAMEDNRDGFVVIVAGYTDLMKKFIGSNPGLKSRFNKYFEFPDYTAQELISIFDLQCSKYEYILSGEAREAVRRKIEEMEEAKGENFANARDVRNLFERIITDQAARIAKMEDPTKEELKMILPEDVAGDGTEEAGKSVEGMQQEEENIQQEEKTL